VNSSVHQRHHPARSSSYSGKSTDRDLRISKASNRHAAYVYFYLLLDNSPSMGVGATTTDITKMVNNTPDQCAFACHDLSTITNDYYSKAKTLGVQMRIDVVRSATHS